MNKKKALVADDDRSIRTFLKELLEIEDFEVFEAQNGKVALEILHAFPDMDLLVTDILMPDTDGITVLFETRREARLTHHIPKIIMISGGGLYASGETYLANAPYLADLTLAKPFSAHEFRQALAKLDMIPPLKNSRPEKSLRRN